MSQRTEWHIERYSLDYETWDYAVFEEPQEDEAYVRITFERLKVENKRLDRPYRLVKETAVTTIQTEYFE